MTPRIVSVHGVKTPPKVPNFFEWPSLATMGTALFATARRHRSRRGRIGGTPGQAPLSKLPFGA